MYRACAFSGNKILTDLGHWLSEEGAKGALQVEYERILSINTFTPNDLKLFTEIYWRHSRIDRIII